MWPKREKIAWYVFVLTARPEYAEDRVKLKSTDSYEQ